MLKDYIENLKNDGYSVLTYKNDAEKTLKIKVTQDATGKNALQMIPIERIPLDQDGYELLISRTIKNLVEYLNKE